MLKTYSKLLVGICLSSILTNQSYSQCTNVPVVEAVDNGSFEKGYPKTGTNGTQYADGSPILFKTGLTYAGDWSPTSACKYAIGDKWGIGKQEASICINGDVNQPPYGVGYIASNTWKDHTKGSKDGYALIEDFFQICSNSQGTLYTGGKPVAWAQDVNVFPNQNYYFSAYIAAYSLNTRTSKLNFVVIPYASDGTTLLTAQKSVSVINIAGSPMLYVQNYTTWNSALYTKALITIEVDATGTDCIQAGDFAIDDISFINSCDKIEGVTLKPDLGPNQSICATNGTITLNSQVATDQGNGRQFFWYSGTGNSQTTLVNGSTSDNTYSITSPGTYRVCITDAVVGNCASNSIVVINDTIALSLKNEELCSSSQITLSPEVTPKDIIGAYIYTWSGPVSENTSSIIANQPGTYNLTVSNYAAGSNCYKTVSAIVTSKFPTFNTPNTQCINQTVTLSNLGTGINKNYYTWYDSQNGGNILSTGESPTLTMPSSGNLYSIFLQDTSTSPLAGSPLYNTPLSTYGDFQNTSITMDVSSKVLLKTVTIKQGTWTGGCQSSGTQKAIIELVSGSTVINSANVNISCGVESTVNLYFNIQPGTYTLRIKGGNGNTFYPEFASTSLSYKAASITDYVSITSSNDLSGPFSKLVFAKSNACERVKVDIPLNPCLTGLSLFVNNTISISPNPVKDVLYFNQIINGVIEIKDLNGKSILSKSVNSDILDLSDLSSGMYLLSIQQEDRRTWIKIIKE